MNTTSYIKNPQGYRLTKEERAFLKKNNREKFSYRTNDEEVLRDKLDFERPEHEWKYMTASDISYKLFEDYNHARMVGKALSERLDYTPKKSSSGLRHFRLIHGKKEYHVPLKMRTGD